MFACSAFKLCTERDEKLKLLDGVTPLGVCNIGLPNQCAKYEPLVQLMSSAPNNPLVSCILPTYNLPARLDCLEESVQSFLKQDYPNKQLVILIDSPDQVIECSHPQVKVINSPTRYSKLSDKLNAAIRASDGELICRLDDDDIMLPNRISSQVEAVKDLDYWTPGCIFAMTDTTLEWQKQRGYGHVQGIFRRAAFDALGGYPDGHGEEDAKLHALLHGHAKCHMGPPSEPTYIYRWQSTVEHISGHGANMPTAFAANATKGQPGTYKLKPHWNREYTCLTKAAGVGKITVPPFQKLKLCVVGFPSKYGGADTELDHQLSVWRAMGVEVHLIPTSDPDAAQLSLGVAARGCIVHKARDWSACAGMHAISYCNGEFLTNLEEIRKYARTTSFVNCMTYVFPKEREAHNKGLIDWFVYQTDHARERVQPQLLAANTNFKWATVRPYFDSSAFPFVEQRDDSNFRFCRVSRDDPAKFSVDTMKIFRDFHSPVPKRGTILGIKSEIYQKVGPPPEFVECVAAGGRPPRDVYAASHVLIQSCDGLENLPRVAMEAMASGCVPICNRQGGFTEIIEHGVSGFLCSSTQEFIDAATKLANEVALRQTMAKAGRDRINVLYGFEAATREWTAFFNKLEQTPGTAALVVVPATDEWLLGDQVSGVLSTFGITKERVSAFLGKPCQCPARQAKLNQLSTSLSRWWNGDKATAENELKRMIK